MSVTNIANIIWNKAQVYYKLETGKLLKPDWKTRSLIRAFAEVVAEQNSILLKEGDRMREGDEWESPVTGLWDDIPTTWIGKRISYDKSNTFSRQQIKIRRNNNLCWGEPPTPPVSL
jgi:hypothetical protein